MLDSHEKMKNELATSIEVFPYAKLRTLDFFWSKILFVRLLHIWSDILCFGHWIGRIQNDNIQVVAIPATNRLYTGSLRFVRSNL